MVSLLHSCGVLLLLLGCSTIIRSDRPSNKFSTEELILDDILNATKYDLRIRPMETVDGENGPTQTRVNMYVRTISNINDMDSEYTVQLTLRQKWKDPRLNYEHMAGKVKYINLLEDVIWTPDLFISNEKTGFINNLMKPNLYYRIYPDGNILFSAKVTLTLACHMNFQWFPFDNQVCSIRMASYAFTTDDLVFDWEETNAVQINKMMDFPHYTLTKMETGTCHSKTVTGEYSCLKVDFFIRRVINFYLIRIFIPCTMLVIISWLGFWLDHQFVMTRLFPVLGSLIVLVFLVADFNEILAPVSYVKSVDIWTGTCLSFVFAALIELVIVDYRWRREAKKQRRAAGVLDTTDEENGVAIDLKPLVQNQEGAANQNRNHPEEAGRVQNFYYRWVSKLPTGPKRLDIISRYVFPMSFATFIILYSLVNVSYFVLA